MSKICGTLPEVVRYYHGRHASFRVRKRTLAYYLVDHAGDRRVGLACKAPEGFAAALVESEPERFYRPAYLHQHGWLGLRLDRGEVDWDEVEDLVTESYVLVAPKRLAAAVGGGAEPADPRV